MTEAQCRQRILDKESLRTQLKVEIVQLKEKLIEFSPIQVGDKVRVIKPSSEERGICSMIEIDYNLRYDYTIKIASVKNPDVPGVRKIWVYGGDKIEKI